MKLINAYFKEVLKMFKVHIVSKSWSLPVLNNFSPTLKKKKTEGINFIREHI